jgi:acetoin utilization deacetylase AcuC-like enzyme
MQARIPIWTLFVLETLPFTHALASIDSATRPFLILYDSTNDQHRDIRFHYEIPERISACVRAIQQFQHDRPDVRVDLVDVAPETERQTPSSEIEKRYDPFSDEELAHARQILLQTHEEKLVTSLEEVCRKAKERRLQEGKTALGHIGYIDSGDTFVTTETFDVCLRAAAAWIRATDNIGGMAMALTRPPGHHATYNQQNGFCLYNFAAAAAIHAIKYRGISKVSILDWDVHYGQGVADIAARHDGIRYVSIHQTPAFPYEGETKQTKGNVMTLPMPPDTTWTCGYADAFDTALRFCATRGEWEPELVIICAGYDALSNDALASTSLDATDYATMSRKLCQHLAASCSQPPRLMLGLEGGYHLGNPGASGNLPSAVVETVQALIDQRYL